MARGVLCGLLQGVETATDTTTPLERTPNEAKQLGSPAAYTDYQADAVGDSENYFGTESDDADAPPNGSPAQPGHAGEAGTLPPGFMTDDGMPAGLSPAAGHEAAGTPSTHPSASAAVIPLDHAGYASMSAMEQDEIELDYSEVRARHINISLHCSGMYIIAGELCS